MGKIIRDPAGFAEKEYDLIIIGGGIYGVMLSFEASKRGLKSLLLEKADFGSATTFNCLRILHGGFRYLQSLDLPRFRESVAERKWFLKTFPRLVEPLPCLMPLYGKGLRRPAILRMAIRTNDFLSRHRNDGIDLESSLPDGKVLNATQTLKIFPFVDMEGLKGGAVWDDACMPDLLRIVIEILSWSCENGSGALNYVEAQDLLINDQKVRGVLAKDHKGGAIHEYKSSVVINAAGPWSRDLAAKFDRDKPELFISSIAWNVFFNKPSVSSHALAIVPKKPNARTYFLVPYESKLLVGTGHAPWYEGPENVKPNDEMLSSFISDLNLAAPSLELNSKDISHVFSGLLPVKKPGSIHLTNREVILNHANHGGPSGFYSISGVKFTTSRLVAEKTIGQIFSESQVLDNHFNIIFDLS